MVEQQFCKLPVKGSIPFSSIFLLSSEVEQLAVNELVSGSNPLAGELETMNLIQKLSREKDNAEFSELVHCYFKLAVMRVMQEIRDKYNVSENEIQTLLLAIFARMLNESCYVLGGQIKNGIEIREIYSKEHLFNLVKILSGESLDPNDRTDIDVNPISRIEKFKEFVLKKASDFYPEAGN